MPRITKQEIPIIMKLGGRRKVVEKLKKRRIKVSFGSVRMWCSEQRGVIPGEHVRELMIIADEEGVPYTGYDFFPVRNPRGETQKTAPKPKLRGKRRT